MYINKNDKDGKCAISGEAAEVRFIKRIKKLGFEVENATIHENMYRHIDVKVTDPKTNETFTVDVKAMKEVSRGHGKQSDYIWLELHGVNNGWIYGGVADYIAFETEQGFIMVNREKLKDLADNLSKKSLEVYYNNGKNVKPCNGLYKIYQRYQRLDKVMLVEKEKIEEIKEMLI